jgi:hypothetical protein
LSLSGLTAVLSVALGASSGGKIWECV